MVDAARSAVIFQIGLAGYGAFFVAGKEEDPGDFVTHKQFEDGWDFHAGFGYIVVLGGLIALVLALVARLGRPRVLLASALRSCSSCRWSCVDRLGRRGRRGVAPDQCNGARRPDRGHRRALLAEGA